MNTVNNSAFNFLSKIVTSYGPEYRVRSSYLSAVSDDFVLVVTYQNKAGITININMREIRSNNIANLHYIIDAGIKKLDRIKEFEEDDLIKVIDGD